MLTSSQSYSRENLSKVASAYKATTFHFKLLLTSKRARGLFGMPKISSSTDIPSINLSFWTWEENSQLIKSPKQYLVILPAFYAPMHAKMLSINFLLAIKYLCWVSKSSTQTEWYEPDFIQTSPMSVKINSPFPLSPKAGRQPFDPTAQYPAQTERAVSFASTIVCREIKISVHYIDNINDN